MPECSAIRLKHDSIRADFYKRCTNVHAGRNICDAASRCPVCTEYFASETHKFFTRPRRHF